jgi:thiosulfate/3-mercaptopyruvate sulfurtransferase
MPVPSIVLVAALVGAYPAGAQLTTGDGLLVSTQWLSQHQHDKDLVILQVGPEPGYRKEHIASSRFVRLKDISTPFQAGSLSLEMPPDATLRTTLEQLGISDRSRVVVVFDSGWVTPSARVFLTLGYAGLSDRAVYLDGGLTEWRKAGLPLTADTVAVAAGHLTRPFVKAVIVDHDYVAAVGKNTHARLLDARSPESFVHAAGGQESPGHIPGAASVPWGTLFDQTSDKMLDKATLEEKFRAAGVQPGDTVVGYCHVGQYATAMLLAARVLGHPIHLYDGSFQDWTMRKLPTEGGQ